MGGDTLPSRWTDHFPLPLELCRAVPVSVPTPQAVVEEVHGGYVSACESLNCCLWLYLASQVSNHPSDTSSTLLGCVNSYNMLVLHTQPNSRTE